MFRETFEASEFSVGRGSAGESVLGTEMREGGKICLASMTLENFFEPRWPTAPHPKKLEIVSTGSR